MNKKYNILIIEDHPIIQSAYNDAFSKYSTEFNVDFNIQTANDCNSAVDIITNSNNIEVVFLDIRIPKNKDFFSGEDIGIFIREKRPNTKIIIATSINNNYRIYNIMQSIKPEGFIIKNDFDTKGVLDAIHSILTDDIYYSKSVLKFLRQQISSDFVLDKIDRQILYELSIGTKTKNLPKLVPLSLSGIERRKRNLRVLFDISDNNDMELIKKAQKQGFI